jgi:hypothetical protein
MESSDQKRRFPPPWRVEQTSADVYDVRDANGVRLASVYCRDDLQKWSFGHNHLTSDETRRIAAAIARLPELLMPAFTHAAAVTIDGSLAGPITSHSKTVMFARIGTKSTLSASSTAFRSMRRGLSGRRICRR